MTEERALKKGELRYVARPSEVGGPRSKKTVWNVYDRVIGSWPRQRPGLGEIKQDMASKEEAELEAARLEEVRPQ
jgi:hypothetical protein